MILDTNAVTALLKRDSAFETKFQHVPFFHLPVIVIGEYLFGLKRSAEAASLTAKFIALQTDSVIAMVSLETARHYSDIREELRQLGRPIPENDVWIAALARQYETPVVSRDRHFDAVPQLTRLDW